MRLTKFVLGFDIKFIPKWSTKKEWVKYKVQRSKMRRAGRKLYRSCFCYEMGR